MSLSPAEREAFDSIHGPENKLPGHKDCDKLFEAGIAFERKRAAEVAYEHGDSPGHFCAYVGCGRLIAAEIEKGEE